jgi:hypothetical protein
VFRMVERLWPKDETRARPADPAALPYVRSYIFMRFAIAVLGIALPIVLVFVEPILFDGQPWPRGSLSAYYYSGMRELFVGTLCAIGVFLIIYKGGEPTREARASTYAGIAVIVVALFPTGKPGAAVPATPLQDRLGEEWVERVHFFAAGLFIGLLWRITRQHFRKHASAHGTFHATCAWLILAALALAAIAGVTGEPDKGILVAEWLAVWAFGASWLRTVEFAILRGDAPAPAAAGAAQPDEGEPTVDAPAVPTQP